MDTSRDNGELFADDGQPTWQKEKRAKEIALDEIVELLNKHHGGTSNDAKRAKADILEEVFCSRSWERIKGMDWPTIKAGREAMWLKLENTPYQFPDPSRKAQEAAAPEFDEDIPQ
ncbi:putative bacteriophage protein [Cronobacter sakazakii 696]|nr:putative bacteriophage protein [Cronobacter sakazakii 696]